MTKTKFNRSQFMKSYHKHTKLQYDKFQTKFPSKAQDVSYSDFMKKDNPLNRQIVVYKVSYQLNYRGEVDSFIIKNKTIRIVAYKGDEQLIIDKVMNSVKDSKGAYTQEHLQPKTIKMIDDHLSVDQPRGLERSHVRPTKNQIREVIEQGVSVSDIDKEIKFTNKKGRVGSLKLDMRHF